MRLWIMFKGKLLASEGVVRPIFLHREINKKRNLILNATEYLPTLTFY